MKGRFLELRSKWYLAGLAYWLIAGGYELYRTLCVRSFVEHTPKYIRGLTIEYVCWIFFSFILSGVLIAAVVKFLLYRKEKRDQIIRAGALYFVPMLLAAAARYVFTTQQWIVPGDEANIYNAAISGYPFLFVYTSFVDMVAMMVFPFDGGVMLFRIIFSSAIVGYAVYRVNKHYNTSLGYLLLFFFYLPTVLFQQLNLHRMQWYAFLYLFFLIKLYFDSKEDISSKKDVVISLMAMSLLTVWRREGIYLFVLGTILLILAYQITGEKRRYAILFILFVEILVYIPPVISMEVNQGKLVGEDVQTTTSVFVWEYTEGTFDYEKCADEWKIANEVLDFEVIDRLKEKYGDAMHLEQYYLWQEGFIALKSEWDDVNWNEFNKAAVSIMIKNPLGYIKSRLSVFLKLQGRLSNLLIPSLIILIAFAVGCMKKNGVVSIACGGLLIHEVITIGAMPAMYFKYFYHIYIIGYVIIFVAIIKKLSYKRSKRKLGKGKGIWGVGREKNSECRHDTPFWIDAFYKRSACREGNESRRLCPGCENAETVRPDRY